MAFYRDHAQNLHFFSSSNQLVFNAAKMHVTRFVQLYGLRRLSFLKGIQENIKDAENKQACEINPISDLTLWANGSGGKYFSIITDESYKFEFWKACFEVQANNNKTKSSPD